MSIKIFFLIVLIPFFLFSQSESDSGDVSISLQKLSAKIDSLNKEDKIFYLGLGLGYRTLITSEDNLLINATISTYDSTLRIQPRNRQDLVISGVLMTYPFKGSSSLCGIPVKNIGFIANINLAKFTEESLNLNNSIIEGGIGLCYRVHNKFSLSLTFEKMFAKRPWDHVKPGNKVYADGEIVTSLNSNDPRFFKDTTFTGYALMFVYSL